MTLLTASQCDLGACLSTSPLPGFQEDFNCKLLAIQAAGQPDEHCDYGFV